MLFAALVRVDGLVLLPPSPPSPPHRSSVADMCTKAARGEVKLEMALFNTQIMGLFPTPNGRMQQYNETLVNHQVPTNPMHTHPWSPPGPVFLPQRTRPS